MASADSIIEPPEIRFVCSTCGKKKTALAFSPRLDSPTGYRYQCRECHGKTRHIREAICPEKGKARKKSYCVRHPERVRNSKKRYVVANPEKVSTTQKVSRKKHHKARKLQNAEYKKTHAEQSRAYVHKRRVLQKTNKVEKFLDSEIFERDKWICQICLKKVKPLLRYPHPWSASLDHVIPIVEDGAHTRQNAVLAHLRCNISKGYRHKIAQQQRLF